MKNFLLRFTYGIITGICEIIPGMSATAAAIALGYYDRMINALNSFIDIAAICLSVLLRKKSLKQAIAQIKKLDYVFIVPLGLGVITAVIVLSGLVLYIYETYTNLFYAALFGLMFAIVITPLRQIGNPTFKEILAMVFTFVFFYLLLGLEGVQISDMSSNPITLFLLGTLAISGMLLPAVSGSFIMLSFGGYYFILSLLRELLSLNISTDHLLSLSAFALGCITGFVITMRLIKRFLTQNRRMFMAVITGMILASIRVVWPFVRLEGEGTKKLMHIGIENFATDQIITMVLISVATFAVFAYLNFKTDKISGDKD